MNSNKHKLLLAISQLTEEECCGFIKAMKSTKEPKIERDVLLISKSKRAAKGSSNATAYNDGYARGYEDALMDTAKSV